MNSTAIIAIVATTVILLAMASYTLLWSIQQCYFNKHGSKWVLAGLTLLFLVLIPISTILIIQLGSTQ